MPTKEAYRKAKEADPEGYRKRLNAEQRAWREKNPEKRKEHHKRDYAKRAQNKRTTSHAWFAANSELARERRIEYYDANSGRILLALSVGLRASDIPDDLAAAKSAQMRMRRFLRERSA